MAVLSVANPTLLDLAKVKDPDGNIAAVVEILNQTNEVLQDISFIEGNLQTGHRSSIRSGLPEPTWRQLYKGVQPSKSTYAQVTDNAGMLEGYSEVDKALADLNGNAAAFRFLEDRGFIEAFGQEITKTLFYGNEAIHPERFTGLAPRFNAISGAENGENIIDGGGQSTDNGSIWLVVWSPMTCHMFVPKGSQAGLQVRDLGEDTATQADGSKFQIYRTHFRQDAGLTLRDWRYVVRIANIDRSDLKSDATTGPDLPDLIHRAITQIPNLSAGRATLYMDRQMLGFLRRQVARLTKESTLTMENVGGTLQTSFMGIPLRRCDALAGDEARVV